MKKIVVICVCLLAYSCISFAASEETLAAERLRIADALKKSGNYKQAYIAYSNVDLYHPFSAESRRARIKIKELQAAHKKALPRFQPSAKALFNKAMLYWDNGDCDSAILYFSKLAKEYPSDKLAGKALLMLGQAELESSNLASTIAALAVQPESPSTETGDRVYYYLGYSLELNNRPSEALQAYWDLLENYPKSDWAADAVWRIGRIFYWSGDYESAYQYLALASQYPRNENTPRALFFQAKAAEKLRKPEDALAIYQYIALDFDRSYYGYRAQEQLKTFGSSSIRPTVEAAGGNISSAMEFNLAQLLQRIKHYRAGIRLVEKQLNKAVIAGKADEISSNLWRLAYPRGYFETVSYKAANNHIDPYLILAVIREESRFNVSARSRSSARGLMQIMPATGRAIAKDLQLKKFRTAKLNNPSINIDMGTHYLSNLIDQFDGNVYMALAGYNGGPNRIKEYINDWYNGDLGQVDIDEFVESIPLRETRRYVQKVMESYFIYKQIYARG